MKDLLQRLNDKPCTNCEGSGEELDFLPIGECIDLPILSPGFLIRCNRCKGTGVEPKESP